METASNSFFLGDGGKGICKGGTFCSQIEKGDDVSRAGALIRSLVWVPFGSYF